MSVRLFANMMAGHTLLKVVKVCIVLGANTFMVVGYYHWLSIALTGLEIVAFLQAYVFAILTCL